MPSFKKEDITAGETFNFTNYMSEMAFTRIFRVDITQDEWNAARIATKDNSGYIHPNELIAKNIADYVNAWLNIDLLPFTEIPPQQYSDYWINRGYFTTLQNEDAKINTTVRSIQIKRVGASDLQYKAIVTFAPDNDPPWNWSYLHDFNVKQTPQNTQYADSQDDDAYAQPTELIIVQHHPDGVSQADFDNQEYLYKRVEAPSVFRPYRTLTCKIKKVGYDNYLADKRFAAQVGSVNIELDFCRARMWLFAGAKIQPLNAIMNDTDEAYNAYQYSMELVFWFDPRGWDPMLVFVTPLGGTPPGIDMVGSDDPNMLQPDHEGIEGDTPYGALRPFMYNELDWWGEDPTDPELSYDEFAENKEIWQLQ